MERGTGWNISFAGCGFTSIYYVGAFSCFLEQAPHLVQGASKISGASSGSVIAAVLTIGMPLERYCKNLMSMAREARKRKLGPLHPSFNLLKMVRDSMEHDLPADAHLRASGRLCVSLTRVSDGKNVLVSEFDSKEELIQVLLCSCFYPFYCGVIPPSYHGVRYVDGALSNNMPHFDLKNTIIVCPFSGESDVCPRESTLNFHEYHQNNASIQFNTNNLHRVIMSFLPPEPEVMAEMCQNGYMDALRFLRENNLLRSESPPAGVMIETDCPAASCYEMVNETASCCERTEATAEETESTKTLLRWRLNHPRKHHWWLDVHSIENLPVSIKKVLCEACRERHAGSLFSQVTELLPVRVASYMFLPVEVAFSIAKRFMDWIPEVPSDIRWLYGLAADMSRQAWNGGAQEINSEPTEVLKMPRLKKCQQNKTSTHQEP
ncbi:patatin-like phospholipase domain-containing protein 2 [Coregonus clupeaformis]|uniref:patatin-like phospholipase domain-containing protein 2 n=1 Tax=Coregonus clupeaformis TaxID=59861 RepID=UPI001BE0BA6A|nr:patatin-like phospholipase domain-containing protein 2 [Coregonus clupeaformis]